MTIANQPVIGADLRERKIKGVLLRKQNRRNVNRRMCIHGSHYTSWVKVAPGIVKCAKCNAQYVTHTDGELSSGHAGWRKFYGGCE